MVLICELRTLTCDLLDCFHLFSGCFCCIAWQRHFDSQIFCLYSQVSFHSWMHIISFSYKSFLKPNRGTDMPTLCHHYPSSFAVHLENFLNSVCFYSKDSSNSCSTVSWTIHYFYINVKVFSEIQFSHVTQCFHCIVFATTALFNQAILACVLIFSHISHRYKFSFSKSCCYI